MIPLAVELLNWLARLPFLAVDDLALLTGSPAPDVEADVRDLARAGQVDSITPSSPELETTRLYVLTEPIRRQVASAAANSPVPVESAAPYLTGVSLSTRKGVHNFRTLRVCLQWEKRKPIPRPTRQRNYRQADAVVGAQSTAR